MKKSRLLVALLSLLSANQLSANQEVETFRIPIEHILPSEQEQASFEAAVLSQCYRNTFEKRSPDIMTVTNSNYPVDISYLIADIKYRRGSLKILEFGEGSRSKYKGFDQIYGAGKMWSRFWHYLSQFNVPMWYVGPSLKRRYRRDEIAYKDFKDLGGTYVRTKQQCALRVQKEHTYSYPLSPPEKIENYHALTVLRHQNASSPAALGFKRDNPYTLIVNHASAPYVNSKFLTNTLFDDPLLHKYKPVWKIYPKYYTPDLAQKIIKEIDADVYVIKPLNAFKGDGIIMVTKNKLNYILKNIIKKTAIIRNSINPTYSHWAHDHNDSFIVERFEPSKTVHSQGRPYDPTLRVVYTLHYSKKVIALTFLGSYWKLPARAMNEKATLVERTKSSIDKAGIRASSVMIDGDDMAEVKKELIKVLPRVYVKMLQTRHLIRE